MRSTKVCYGKVKPPENGVRRGKKQKQQQRSAAFLFVCVCVCWGQEGQCGAADKLLAHCLCLPVCQFCLPACLTGCLHVCLAANWNWVSVGDGCASRHGLSLSLFLSHTLSLCRPICGPSVCMLQTICRHRSTPGQGRAGQNSVAVAFFLPFSATTAKCSCD